MRALVLALLMLASVNAMAQSFGELVNEAERVRTTDRKQFDSLLARLDQVSGRATLEQQMHLRLLHAYQPLLAGDYNRSIEQLQQMLADKPQPLYRFRANVALMTNFAALSQFSEALQALEKALALRNKIDDAGIRQQGTFAAAILYNEIGQYKIAERYAAEVLAQPFTERNACIAGESRVDALLNLGIYQSDSSIDSAIQRCRVINENIPAGRLVVFLARKWMAENKTEQAIQLLRDQMRGVDATQFPRSIGEAHATLAEALAKQGDFKEAKSQAQIVINHKEAIANTPPLASSYKILSDIAVQEDDLVTALDNYKLYADTNKGYLNEVKTRELAYQLVRIEGQQKNQQIELLDRQNRLLQLQQEVDRTSAQNSRLLMLVFALGAALVAFWAYKTKRLHASLRQMAQTDALTGVCNRHHFTILAEQSLALCALAGEPAALLMFDLDHFKAVNDSYGHITGDWVLKRVADTCKHFCRRMDHLGRQGGEEFAILLHGFDLHAATRLAEDCRVRIAGIDTRESGYHFTVTASFGVSATSLSGYDLAKLLSHADLMLYRAKREGRNRVRTYAPEMPITLRPQAVEAGQVVAVVPPLGPEAASDTPAGG